MVRLDLGPSFEEVILGWVRAKMSLRPIRYISSLMTTSSLKLLLDVPTELLIKSQSQDQLLSTAHDDASN